MFILLLFSSKLSDDQSSVQIAAKIFQTILRVAFLSCAVDLNKSKGHGIALLPLEIVK